MCGRFIISADLAQLKRRFDIETVDFQFSPRYNVAPTQAVPVVTCEEKRELKLLQWGLIPFWAKDPAIGHKLINARAESLLEKPSFKNPFIRRRCLIPATGFYEWQKTAAGKMPISIMMKDRGIFAFAGLWDSWQSPAGKVQQTFTIITTEANSLVKPIHQRMPVILTPEEEELWLNLRPNDINELIGLLDPFPSEQMEAFAVSKLVNLPDVDSPECIRPL